LNVDVVVKRPVKIFYGWWVVLAATIIGALGGGIITYGFTTFFLPLSAELGLTRAAYSAVISVSRLEGSVEGPIVGWLIDRFGARKLMVIGLLLFSAGFIGMYWMNSLPMFIILFVGVISIGYNTGFLHGSFALANKWFIRQRSKATGIVSMSFGIGGAAIVPVLAWLILQHGWRIAAFTAGAVTLVIGLPMLLVIRSTPEDKGFLPDGKVVDAKEVAEKPGEATGEINFTVREAIKAPAFWVLCLALSLRTLVTGGIWVHMVPLLVFKEFDEQAAANAVGLCLMFTIPVRFIFGWLGDIYPKRYLLALCCLIGTVALTILLTAQSLWQVYLFVIIFALSYGVAPLQQSIIGDYFGRKRFATIRGTMALIEALPITIGPIYAGYIYDVTHSYQVAFVAFIVVYFLAAIVFFLAKSPKPPVRVTGYSTS